MIKKSMTGDSKVLFVSWALNCSRSDGIAARLGGTSYMVYSPFWGSRYSTILFKYACQMFMTLRLLFRERPKCVFVMTPPVVACIGVWLYAKFMKGAYIIDAHTAAFVDAPWRWMLFVHAFFSRCAATTIVTNSHLQKVVESWGANATIVSDVPVVFAAPAPVPSEDQCAMTFISSFTKDEPLEVFFEAVRELPNIRFFVTGDYKAIDHKLLKCKPANVQFTGYLADSDYVGRLMASDVIISLTTAEHTMQRGAYEAVYLGKPVITSNTEVLRTSFYKGAVHVNAIAEDIRRGIVQIESNIDEYRRQAEELRVEKLEQWQRKKINLCELIFGEANNRYKISESMK